MGHMVEKNMREGDISVYRLGELVGGFMCAGSTCKKYLCTEMGES